MRITTRYNTSGMSVVTVEGTHNTEAARMVAAMELQIIFARITPVVRKVWKRDGTKVTRFSFPANAEKAIASSRTSAGSGDADG